MKLTVFFLVDPLTKQDPHPQVDDGAQPLSPGVSDAITSTATVFAAGAGGAGGAAGGEVMNFTG